MCLVMKQPLSFLCNVYISALILLVTVPMFELLSSDNPIGFSFLASTEKHEHAELLHSYESRLNFFLHYYDIMRTNWLCWAIKPPFSCLVLLYSYALSQRSWKLYISHLTVCCCMPSPFIGLLATATVGAPCVCLHTSKLKPSSVMQTLLRG